MSKEYPNLDLVPFEDGVPKFVLRADDPRASAALKAYVLKLPLDSDERREIEELYDSFLEFQGIDRVIDERPLK